MPVHFPDGVRVNRLCYSQVQALASWASKGIPARTRATVAGQIYYVSAWIRIDSQQQTATWGGIRVQVQDANWNNLNNVVLTPATSPYGQWTRVQFSFVAAGTSSRLSAGPFTDGLYTVSLDDFVVSASPVAGAPSHGGDKVLAKPAVSAPQQQGGGAISTRNYYFFNGTRIAMSRNPRSVNRNGERDRGRQCSGTCSSANPGTVTWLHSDLLGSATLATNASGQPLAGSETRYAPFGTVRFGGAGLPNDRRFNGNTTDIAGLLDYGARAYDPLIGRFISADTIVPNPADPQTFNRYSYGLSNPLRYADPSGHFTIPVDQVGQWLVAAAAGFVGTFASPAVVVAGVAGGSVIGLTVACFAYCSSNWAEPQYESFPLSDESGSEIMTTPLVSGQTTTLLTSPLGMPSLPTIETYPTDSEAVNLKLATPLEGSSTMQTTRLMARVYEASPKHAKGGRGTPIGLDDATAQNVLDSGSQYGKQIYGYKEGDVYVFQKTNGDIWHGYKAS